MKKLPKLNEKLLAKALEHIKMFPDSYNQQTVTEQVDKTEETPCGAIGCFGGWIKLLSLPKGERHEQAINLNENDTLEEAGRMVGFTTDETGYVFASTNHSDPKVNYKIIVGRLQQVRAAREKILNSKYYRAKLLIEEAEDQGEDRMEVAVHVRNDEPRELDYSELLG